MINGDLFLYSPDCPFAQEFYKKPQNRIVLPIYMSNSRYLVNEGGRPARAISTHPPLYGFVGQEFEVYQTYFEFRRAISDIEQDDLEITYRKDGEVRTLRCGAETNVDSDLDVKPPLLLSKFLYFRPVFKGERSYCLH